MSDMTNTPSVIIVIPSRLGSSRFPNKPLALIDGKEMILRVCERASKAFPVVVATPDQKIYDLVIANGYQSVITSPDCLTGTDRVAEVSENIYADIYVNVQGDEPLIDPDDIIALVNIKKLIYNKVINGMSRISQKQSNSPHIVKVKHKRNNLISMTRAGTGRYKQTGIYAFNREQLLTYKSISETEKLMTLLKHENIEILRFIELGIPIFMTLVKSTPAVDVPEDIEKILEVIRNGT
jgi:3-deoxy-manno-octulosonate cytidylyltransferase (CMP-KDO synthetase)